MSQAGPEKGSLTGIQQASFPVWSVGSRSTESWFSLALFSPVLPAHRRSRPAPARQLPFPGRGDARKRPC